MFGRLLVPAVVIAACAGSVWAQVDEAAKARLQAASEAIRGLEALSFKVKVTATGSIAKYMPTAEGTVDMLRQKSAAGADVWLVHATGQGQANARETPAPFEVAWLNGQGRSADFAAKKVFQNAGKPRGASRAAESLKIKELTEAEPLRQALGAANIALLESAEVGGVACDVIETSTGKSTKERVFISKEDNLPRRFVRVFDTSMMAGEWAMDLLELTRRTDLSAESFEFAVPAGFTEERAQAAAPAGSGKGDAAADQTAPGQAAPGLATNGPAQADAAPAPAAPRGALAPQFELSDAAGNKVSLESLRGNIVVLDFWGTWCIPCRASHKELQAMADALKDKPVKVLSLSVREKTKEAPGDYMKKHGYTFAALIEAEAVAEQYKVKAYPTFVLIGADGAVMSRFEAFKREETIPAIQRMIEETLSNPGRKVDDGEE